MAPEDTRDHIHENCRHLLGALSEYVDETAGQEICAEIERHLQACENCRVVVDTLRKTVYLVHASADVEMPVDVRQRLYKRLKLDDLA
ncbi:MAG: anti-sigma factor family protein [Chloroflexota bacterium]